MAHFAQLDQSGVVLSVIVIDNNVVNNLPFPESEPMGIAFCQSLYGENTVWKQTSYNANFRYNYAANGCPFIFEAQPDGAFLLPKPYPSWLLDTKTYQWIAPIPMPNVPPGYEAYWDEETQEWYLVHTGKAT